MPFLQGNKYGQGRRPAGRSLSEALRVALSEKLPDGRTNYRAVADMLVERAREGDIAATREIFNRIEGPVAAAENDATAGRPIVINVLPQDEATL